MTLIIDAQLSPHLVPWIRDNFGIDAVSVQFLGLRDAADQDIFTEARLRSAIVMTKDEDFVQLFHRLGSPPKIIWITCGNTSNSTMKAMLARTLPRLIC